MGSVGQTASFQSEAQESLSRGFQTPSVNSGDFMHGCGRWTGTGSCHDALLLRHLSGASLRVSIRRAALCCSTCGAERSWLGPQ